MIYLRCYGRVESAWLRGTPGGRAASKTPSRAKASGEQGSVGTEEQRDQGAGSKGQEGEVRPER